MSPEGASLVRRFEIKKVTGHSAERVLDPVAVEEPLEIDLSYWFKGARSTTNLAVTMRTPGNDRELVAGYLVTEGILAHGEQLCEIRSLGIDPSNEIMAELAPAVDVDAWRSARSSFLGASCGICGKRSRDTLAAQIPSFAPDRVTFPAEMIERLPDLLAPVQKGFAQTGGLHAAALIGQSGEVLAAYEDVGRHNALDKVIGHAFLNDLIPLQDYILFLSSRSSFELIQKAAMAGGCVLATVGGPSSLAIEAARDYGLTLIGFIRGGRFNVYSGEWRIKS